MTRAEIERWLHGHAVAAAKQRELAVAERDSARAVAHSLSLIAALRATIAPEVVERQREADDARVRETWSRLRRSRA